MVAPNRSSQTLADLQEVERTVSRSAERPDVISPTKLTLASDVFQWRKFTSSLEAEEYHLKELVRVLQSSEKPLDPILVTVVGDSFFVVDGHHRTLAYHLAKWSSPVPVVYFEGSVAEARLEGLKLNSKNKLPMTRDDKFEAAWTLVKEGRKYSKSDIADMTSVSERTIGTMRATLKEHPETEKELWSRAKRHHLESSDDFDHDDWVDQAAQKMAEQIMKNVGPNLTKRPDVLALALQKINEKIPRELIYEWLPLVNVIRQEQESEEWQELHGPQIF